MDEFRPMDVLRAIRDDRSLTTAERGWLMTMVLGTDNKTGRVRRSLERLCEEAGCHRSTGQRYITSKEVAKYFKKTTVNAFVANYEWLPVSQFETQYVSHSETQEEASVSQDETQSEEQEEVSVSQFATPVSHSAHPVSHIETPSTLSSTLSSTDGPSAGASVPCPLLEQEEPASPLLSIKTDPLGVPAQDCAVSHIETQRFKELVRYAVAEKKPGVVEEIMMWWDEMEKRGVPEKVMVAAYKLIEIYEEMDQW